MKYSNLLFRLFIMIFFMVASIIPVSANASSVNSTQKKILKEAVTDFNVLMNYVPGKIQLDNWNAVVPSKKIAQEIMKGKERKNFLNSYYKAKKAGLSISNNVTMKDIQATYAHTMAYLEAVIAIDDYYSSVSKSKLISATAAKSLGAASNKDVSKKRGKAYKEYADVIKKKETQSKSKRMIALNKKYVEVTNYLLGAIELEAWKKNIKEIDSEAVKKEKAKKLLVYSNKLENSSVFRTLIDTEFNKVMGTSNVQKKEEAIVTADSLNVRKGPATTYEIVKSIKKDEKFDIILKKAGWVQIQWENGSGWVKQDFVKIQEKKDTPPIEKPSTEKPFNKDAVITVDRLNLRAKADNKSEIVTQIPYGTQVTLTAVKDEWVKTSYNGQVGYIHSGYISYDLNSTIQSYLVLANELAVYKSESKDSTILYTAKKDEKLKVYIKDGNWYKVKLATGAFGYVYIVDNKKATADPTKPLTGYTILLDAGHGGGDPGNTGFDGITLEKTLNLIVTRNVRTNLEAYGATVVMTRDGDYYPTLTDRTNQSNKLAPDAFISMHHDWYSSSSANGFTVFFYHENARILSSTVNTSMASATTIRNRGSKFENYHVLRENKYPAILIEFGFMSNPIELEILKTDIHQQTMSKAIADGVVKFFQ